MTSSPTAWQQPCDAVADHGLAAVAERERSGRVRGDELDLDAATRPRMRRDAKPLPARTSSASPRLPAGIRQPDVQEAGARHLGARDQAGGIAELRGERLGDLAGLAAERFGENQRGIAGVVAVLGRARWIELEGRRLAREARLGEQLVDAALEGFAQALFHGG